MRNVSPCRNVRSAYPCRHHAVRKPQKSTAAQCFFAGAGYGNRTRLSWLGTKYSTDELTLPVYGFILSPIPFFVKPREKIILAFRS